MSYIVFPRYGSYFFQDPVATTGDLPATDPQGTVRLVTGSGDLYWYNGSSWVLIAGGVDSVADTNSIDMTLSSGILSADLRISANAASAGNIIIANNIESTSSVGLRSQIAIANGSTSGGLTSADWTTFNNKEPAISAGTTSQYWRGDKTFQTLNIAALQAITNGSSASSGQLNEILTGTEASNTTTGVGASGTYGSVTSVPLSAGRWILQGVAGFNENGATLTTAIECGISDSATGVGLSEFDTTLAPFLISSTSDALLSTPMIGPISIASPTTYYLNTRFYYSAGTPRHRGRIQALRIG